MRIDAYPVSLPLALLLAACASPSTLPRAARGQPQQENAYRHPAKANVQAAVAVAPSTAISPSRSAYTDRMERALLDFEARLAAARIAAGREESRQNDVERLDASLTRAREELTELRSVSEGGAVWSSRRNRLDVTMEDLRRGWERVRAE